MYRLCRLKIIELRENNLMTLPKSISRLVQSERFDIGQNSFIEFPEVLSSLPNLSELWCDANRISIVPEVDFFFIHLLLYELIID